jgi:hypothetical protein
VADSLYPPGAERPEDPPPAEVLEQLREGFSSSPEAALGADETIRLAEAVRGLAVRHGPSAVRHCIQLVESLRALLDEATGTGEARP